MIYLPRSNNLKICLHGSGKAISTSLSEISLLHHWSEIVWVVVFSQAVQKIAHTQKVGYNQHNLN